MSLSVQISHQVDKHAFFANGGAKGAAPEIIILRDDRSYFSTTMIQVRFAWEFRGGQELAWMSGEHDKNRGNNQAESDFVFLDVGAVLDGVEARLDDSCEAHP